MFLLAAKVLETVVFRLKFTSSFQKMSYKKLKSLSISKFIFSEMMEIAVTKCEKF